MRDDEEDASEDAGHAQGGRYGEGFAQEDDAADDADDGDGQDGDRGLTGFHVGQDVVPEEEGTG